MELPIKTIRSSECTSFSKAILASLYLFKFAQSWAATGPDMNKVRNRVIKVDFGNHIFRYVLGQDTIPVKDIKIPF